MGYPCFIVAEHGSYRSKAGRFLWLDHVDDSIVLEGLNCRQFKQVLTTGFLIITRSGLVRDRIKDAPPVGIVPELWARSSGTSGRFC